MFWKLYVFLGFLVFYDICEREIRTIPITSIDKVIGLSSDYIFPSIYPSNLR